MKFLFLPASLLFIFVHSIPIQNDSSDGSREISPETIGEHFEGDMIFLPMLTPRDAIAQRQINRWPNGIVPYEIDSSISESHTSLIVKTMRLMENLTKINDAFCTQFRPKNSLDVNFIRIQNGTGCSGPVGVWTRSNSSQIVTLMHTNRQTCMTSGIIQHELGHVLGFMHEQSRADRDIYVSIQWNNILSDHTSNFNKYSFDTFNISYDYGSIMHYGQYAFTIDSNLSTIIPILNKSAIIGQRSQLSQSDIRKIRQFYGCIPTIPNQLQTIAND
ncbi:hypothetical protein I4U23_023201 [Adineta vaga]|nr:hypothetical protein I4U23_023201 [Adineta vaga]